MICAVPQPIPERTEKKSAAPLGSAKPLIIASTKAKIKVPKVEPKIWLTGLPPILDAIVG